MVPGSRCWKRCSRALSMSFLGAIDEGTSSTRFVVTDLNGKIISSEQRELTQHHEQAGYSELDPVEIWEVTKSCISASLRKVNLSASDIAAIGITNQRESTVIWNKNTGIPYHNAILWNDNRTSNICERFRAKETERYPSTNADKYMHETGLPLAPYFSVSKIIYLLENVAGLREAAESGEAIFGTIDTWLIYKLTGGTAHVTDVTNASR